MDLPKKPKRWPAEGELPFEYDFEQPAEEVLTAYAGIPLLVRAARSFDVQGRLNSIQESGPNATPSATLTIGDTEGKLDISKAVASSVGPALAVVAGVLGVESGGITEDLIAQFAVSQSKLANAPIIDAARIVDAAVTTAKIKAAAITTALIKDAAITTAKIGDLEVTSAKIASLAADKITTGTMSADRVRGCSLEGIGYLSVTGSGVLTGSLSCGALSCSSTGTSYLNVSGQAVVSSSLSCGGLTASSITSQGTIGAAGNITTSGVFKKGGSSGVSGSVTLAKLTEGGSTGSLTFSGGIITGYTNPT